MRYKPSLSIILILGYLIVSYSTYGQQGTNETHHNCNIDSIFVANFEKLDKSVKWRGSDDSCIDRIFVYTLAHLSGIDYETSDYSGFPYYNSTNLKDWKDWYKLNKNKISCSLYLRVYELIKKFPKTESEMEELKKLRII